MSARSPVFELRVALTVDDYDAALRFYRDGLGLPLVREFGDGDAKGGILAAGVATLEIVTRSQSAEIDLIEVGRPASGPVRLAIEVADSDAAAERLESAGGEKMGEPVSTPWGHRNVRLKTPEGVQITLFTVLKT